MKRQFVQIQHSQGNEVPVQNPPVDASGSSRPPSSSWKTSPPEPSLPKTPGRLLSNHGSGTLPYGQTPQAAPSGQSGQAVPFYGPVTDPVIRNNGLQDFFPGYTPQQASPGATGYPSYPGPQNYSPQAAPSMSQPPQAYAAPPASRPSVPPQSQQPLRLGQPPTGQQPQAYMAPPMSQTPQMYAAPPMVQPSVAPQPQQPLVLGQPSMQRPAQYQNMAYAASAPAAPPYSPMPQMPSPAGYQNYSGYPPGYPPASPPAGPPPKKKRRGSVLARVALTMLILLIVLGSGGYWYYQSHYATAIDNITGKTAIHSTTTQKGKASSTSSQATTVDTNTVLTGNRVNILLLGSDNDGKGNDGLSGAPLAQTDIIVTIDPQTKQVGMLSIPRDMQVTEAGYTAPKLDEVFSHGWNWGAKTQADHIASAAGHVMDVIQNNYGIHIDHYAWVGLGGFIKVIDSAGGVDVDVTHPMVDDVYPDDTANSGDIYGNKRLYIAPGPQHLNGQDALQYVRTRHSDLVGDFGRSARQQQVLSQLKVKLARPDVVAQAPQLLTDLNGSVQTDLNLTQIVEMANLARGIDLNNIDRVTLSPPYSASAGAHAVRSTNYFPICSQITPVIQRMFAIQPTCLSQGSTGTAGIAANAQPVQSTSIAAASAPSVTAASGTANASGVFNAFWQSLSQMSQSGALSQNLDPNGLTFPAIHGLLDLMFVVVFESFDAIDA